VFGVRSLISLFWFNNREPWRRTVQVQARGTTSCDGVWASVIFRLAQWREGFSCQTAPSKILKMVLDPVVAVVGGWLGVGLRWVAQARRPEFWEELSS
jgi:hypothetical protein